jgi:antirestriction protein ArdC
MAKRESKKTGKEVRESIQREMTDRIIAAVKAGTPPWRKPWACSPNAGWPQNIVSKKSYRGMNPLLLECTCMDMGFASRWWATYKQWADLGVQVKKRPDDVDYWGTRIVFWRPMKGTRPKDKNDPDGEKEKFTWFMLKTYVVFNMEQVDDPDGKLDKYKIDETANQIDPKSIEDPMFEMTREVIAATKADIRHGGERAFYTLPQPYEDWPKHKKGDYITVPEPGRFVSPQDYYYTLLHEIGHWTEVRLGQKDDKYAFNELVAEIASCFIASACNIPETSVRDNHERYVASWLGRMGDDPSFIFRASSAAAKACDYVLHFSGHAEIEEDEDEVEEQPKLKPRKTKKQQAA